MPYVLRVDQSPSFQTLSKAFLTSMKLCFSIRFLQLNICSVLLLSFLKPDRSSEITSLACEVNLFNTILNIILL